MSNRIVAVIVAVLTILSSSALAGQPIATAPTHFTVTTQGTGPDVILIPGLASPRDVYAHEAALLAPHYRLHLVQINGFGSQPAGVNASGALLMPTVEELHAYIQAQQLRQPALLGHSLGGLLALMLAAVHPGDTGRVLVVDSLPFVGLMFRPDATVEAVQPMAAAMRDGMMKGTQATYAAQEEMAMARLVKNPEQREMATTWASASDRGVVARAMYEDFTTDIRPELNKITAPVTVLYPWDAAIGPQDPVRDLYVKAFASLTQVKLVQIDASYHFIMLDQPAAFHAAVVEFLR